MPKPRFPTPPQAHLRELFDYDPETGHVTSKVTKTGKGGYQAGDVIGYPSAFGYLKLTVDGKPYALHRLIWKWMTGEEPPSFIDHADRDKQNNRWANLRKADARLNVANRPVTRISKSGVKGVAFSSGARKWTAMCAGKHLGVFETADQAAAAYEAEAKAQYGDFACSEGRPQSVFYEIVELTDRDFCEKVAAAVRRMWSYQIDPDVPAHVARKLEEIGCSLSADLAQIDPERYGRMKTSPS